MPRSATDYEPLWYWIREREAIRIRKECVRSDPPWTSDSILATYRFCNVRREDDRVTRWIARHVREPYRDHPLLWLAICACRQINWPPTIAELIKATGAWPTQESFTPARMGEALRARRRRDDKVYTGAYVIAAPADGSDKQAYIAEVVLGDLHRRRGEVAGSWRGRTLRETHAWLRRSPGWGDFMSYQAVVDMRFCHYLLADADDREVWAAAGPGTIRGLHRVHGRPIDAPLTQEQALDEVREIYARSLAQTGVVMDLSDVPNALCETDKYLRVKNGEGRPRAKYVLGRGA
jgi:hypothetical protein